MKPDHGKEIYLHVGTYKTGSTFLQDKVFGHVPELAFFKHGDQEIMAPLLACTQGNVLFTELDRLRQDIGDVLARLPENKALISHEDLSGYIYGSLANNKATTDVLKSIFPNARIILVIRRQDTFMESAYLQTLKRGMSIPVRHFVGVTKKGTFLTRRPDLEWPKMNVLWLDWKKYIDNYVNTFGRDNVLVLPFELFREDNKTFLDQIYEFMGVAPYYPPKDTHVNRGFSALSARLAYIFNRFIRNDANPSGFLKEQPLHYELKRMNQKSPLVRLGMRISAELNLQHFLEHRLDKLFYTKAKLIPVETKARILEVHKGSNEQIEQEYGVPLKRFGYY
jgi:hypothetical protein